MTITSSDAFLTTPRLLLLLRLTQFSVKLGDLLQKMSFLICYARKYLPVLLYGVEACPFFSLCLRARCV